MAEMPQQTPIDAWEREKLRAAPSEERRREAERLALEELSGPGFNAPAYVESLRHQRDEWRDRYAAKALEADALRKERDALLSEPPAQSEGQDEAARNFRAGWNAAEILLRGAAPEGQRWKCAMCGKPATCYGSYEGQPSEFACDDCCGNGCEDGHCVEIRAPEQPHELPQSEGR